MIDAESEQAIPVTDPQEIEKVAAEIHVAPNQIESVDQVPLNGRVIEDIVLHNPDGPKQIDTKLTLGSRLRRIFSGFRGDKDKKVEIVDSEEPKSGNT